MHKLNHKGYIARVEFDAEDSIFVGHITGINDVVGFHADTVADLIAAFQAAVDDDIETGLHAGKAPEEPYSGKRMLRVSLALA